MKKPIRIVAILSFGAACLAGQAMAGEDIASKLPDAALCKLARSPDYAVSLGYTPAQAQAMQGSSASLIEARSTLRVEQARAAFMGNNQLSEDRYVHQAMTMDPAVIEKLLSEAKRINSRGYFGSMRHSPNRWNGNITAVQIDAAANALYQASTDDTLNPRDQEAAAEAFAEGYGFKVPPGTKIDCDALLTNKTHAEEARRH